MAAITTNNTTLEYFDGFEDYSTAQLARYWTNIGNTNFSNPAQISAGNGRNSSSSLRMNNDSQYVSITLTPQSTRTIGFAFRILNGTRVDVFGNSLSICALLDVNTVQLYVRLNPDLTLSVVRGGSVLSTTIFSLSRNVFYYIEFTSVIDPSAGSYRLVIDGVSQLSASGVNTRNTANSEANVVLLGVVPSGGTVNDTVAITDYDDFYCKTDGTLLGDCRIESELPSSNGDTIQWIPLAGTNYSEVNENPATDDTTYNFSSVAGNFDVYHYPALLTMSGTVFAVMTVPVLRVDTAGVATACSSYRALSTDYVGGTHPVGATTYTAYMDIQGQDPSTSAAWTIPGINATQFGAKRLT